MDKIIAYWKERLQSLSAYAVILGVLVGLFFIGNLFHKKAEQPTSATQIRKIESGANVTFNTTNSVQPTLKQGFYVQGASDRASLGIFKEVTPNIEIAVGGGKRYDDNSSFIEVEARAKF